MQFNGDQTDRPTHTQTHTQTHTHTSYRIACTRPSFQNFKFNISLAKLETDTVVPINESGSAPNRLSPRATITTHASHFVLLPYLLSSSFSFRPPPLPPLFFFLLPVRALPPSTLPPSPNMHLGRHSTRVWIDCLCFLLKVSLTIRWKKSFHPFLLFLSVAVVVPPWLPPPRLGAMTIAFYAGPSLLLRPY